MTSLRKLIQKQHDREQASTILSGQCECDATTLRNTQLKNGRLRHLRYFGMSKRGDPTCTIVYRMHEYTTPAGGKTRVESVKETDPIMRNTQVQTRGSGIRTALVAIATCHSTPE